MGRRYFEFYRYSSLQHISGSVSSVIGGKKKRPDHADRAKLGEVFKKDSEINLAVCLAEFHWNPPFLATFEGLIHTDTFTQVAAGVNKNFQKS